MAACLRAKSEKSARFAVVTGRRRIGKTSLLLHAFGDAPMLYFFVARQAERELCETFRAEIEDKLGEPVGGAFASFADVFDYVMRVSEKRSGVTEAPPMVVPRWANCTRPRLVRASAKSVRTRDRPCIRRGFQVE